jgi:MFS family permease
MVAIPLGLLAIIAVPEPVIKRQGGPDPQSSTSVLSIFKTNPVLLIIYGLMFFTNLLLYSIVVFLPQLLEGFGISSTFFIGLFITTMTAAGGVTAFVYGKIRSRLSYYAIAIMAVALWVLAFATISLASASWIIAIAVALFGISQGLILPTVMVWIGAVVPPSFRGRFSSYLGTFGFVGQFLSPIVFAPILILLGFQGVFLTGAGVGAVWFGLLWAIRSRGAK